MDKLSYALGMAIGHQLKDLCLEHLEVADFAAAVSDVLAGKQPQLGDQEAQQIVQQGLAECERRQQEAREKAGAVCRQEGEAFLAANGWRVRRNETLPASFPLTYAECVKEEEV